MSWFRRAVPASPSWNLLKTAAQIAVFWSMFLFLLPYGVLGLAASAGVFRAYRDRVPLWWPWPARLSRSDYS